MTTGGCRCGAIRYRLDAAPIAVRTCWCRDCQYWACGNATVNIIVPRAALHVAGAPARYESTADSGHHMCRSFCASCGTQLFSEAHENADALVIRVGTLDDPSEFAPERVIWTDSAPAWASIDGRLPTVARQPG